jgi:hypothetical protein
MDCFGTLHSTLVNVFACGVDCGEKPKASLKPDLSIGPGRLCLEDFTEIVFLVEHGYGYAALKLLRGLYYISVP